MGQLQSKPAKLRTVSLLLRFSEGNACPCKSCHFRFLGISLGGVRKKRENARSWQTCWSFKLWAKVAAGNGDVLYFYAIIYLDWYMHTLQPSCLQVVYFLVTFSPAFLFIAIFVIKMLIYLQISTTVYVQGQFMSHFQRKNG